ncbi:MAG: hypothetical protein LC794_18375 [Acidobacteria bacterium]|nr:hypothetical protein [Acidobacteriota bacterium]
MEKVTALNINGKKVSVNAHPQIEIVLVDRKDLPSAGAGETPIVGLAPAVSNAIFAATGKRLRSLPLVPKGLQS